MPHETPLIATLVAGFVLAFIFGAIANRLRLPPLVGYLVAGLVIGPNTPGYVADQSLAPELAEIGVILLMFGVGLHFSLKDLWSVRLIAVPGAVVQITVATALGWGLGALMGWPVGAGLIFGLALSVASTVVLLRAMHERRLIETERGRIAVGWLVVEDLVMVLALVLIPALAQIAAGGAAVDDPLTAAVAQGLGLGTGVFGALAATLIKLAAFVVLMLVVGRRVIPWVLHHIAHTGSRELFRLGVLAIALGVAFGAAKLFGVSLALGAFFAGMILSESELSHEAAHESLPLRDAFAVLFFVAAGMLFNPAILVEQPAAVLATLAIIVAGKSVAAYLIVRAFGHGAPTALTISASLAQIGEFSFILAELGVGLGLLPETGRDLIIAGAILSIVLNPFVFRLTDRLASGRAEAEGEAATGTPAPVAAPADHPEARRGHTILVGYGRVGTLIARALDAAGTPFVVIEDADDRIARLTEAGVPTVAGNAASGTVLALAGIADARALVIAIPNAFEAAQVAEQARRINPALLIVARADSAASAEHLTHHGADSAIVAEPEIARAMVARLDAPVTA